MEQSKKKDYAPINLPKEMIEELKAWRLAFSACYGRSVSYEEIMRKLLNSISQTCPEAYRSMESMVENNAELKNTMKSYNF